MHIRMCLWIGGEAAPVLKAQNMARLRPTVHFVARSFCFRHAITHDMRPRHPPRMRPWACGPRRAHARVEWRPGLTLSSAPARATLAIIVIRSSLDGCSLHSPLPSALGWLADRRAGVPTIRVAGNHAFWRDGGDDRYTHDGPIARGRDAEARHGVHLLRDDAVTLDDIRFLGATGCGDLPHTAFGLASCRAHAEGRRVGGPRVASRAVQFYVNPVVSNTRLMSRAARQRVFWMLSHPVALIRL